MATMKQSKILASSCRRRILRALSKRKELTMMKLVRTINSTYNEVDRNLRILEREGLVTQRYVGRKRVIRLNFKNEKTMVSLEILKILENSVDLKQLRRSLKHLIENINENGNCLQDLLNSKNGEL